MKPVTVDKCSSEEDDDDDASRSTGFAEVWSGYGTAVTSNVFRTLKVSSMSLGEAHVLLLASDHNVYCFGEGAALGLGSKSKKVTTPTIIPDLLGKRVSSISCGPANSAAVCDDGSVFMWGDNTFGQCAQAVEHKFIIRPAEVLIKNNVHRCAVTNSVVSCAVAIAQVACAEKHTLAFSDVGDLWIWGSETELGAPDVIGRNAPTKMDFFDQRRVISIACGADHNLVVVSSAKNDIHSGENTSLSSEFCAHCSVSLNKSSIEGTVSQQENCCPLGLELSASGEELSTSDDGDAKVVQVKQAKEIRNSAVASSKHLSSSGDTFTTAETHSPQEQLAKVSSLSVDANAGAVSNDSESKVVESSAATEVLGDNLETSDVVTQSAKVDAILPSENQNPVSFSSLTDSFSKYINISAINSYLARQFSSEEEDVKANSCVSLENIRTGRENSTDTIDNQVPLTSKRDSRLDVDVQLGLEMVTYNPEIKMLDDNDSNESVRSLDLDSQRATTIRKHSKVSSSCDRMNRLKDESLRSINFLSTESTTAAAAAASTFKLNQLTEVWTWGKGSDGQLGHGDALCRTKPVRIKTLDGAGIMKVSAGKSHSLALTVDGRLFLWGSNAYGQLAVDETERLIYSPRVMSISDKAFVWEIAAGNKSTLILVNQCGEQLLYYCGKQEGPMSKAESMKTSVLVLHSVSNENCKIRQIYGGGPYSGCILERVTGGKRGILYELTDTELQYYKFLNNLVEMVVKPVLSNDDVASRCGETVKSLLECFVDIADNAARNGHHLRYVIQNPVEKGTLSLFHDMEQQLEHYSRYCEIFCDTLAINGFSAYTKAASALLKTAVPLLRRLSSEQSTKDDISPETLQHLMEEPIRRMMQYQKLFSNLGQHNKQRNRPNRREREVAKRWSQLISIVSAHKNDSERTRAFWDSCSQKICDALKSPKRRIIRDSKLHGVNMLNAGRFSSHSFILFNDIFVHHTLYSGAVAHDLALVWIDPTPDLEGDGNAFQVIVPEDTFTLICENTQEKVGWVCALNDAINAAISCGPNKMANRKQIAARRAPPLIRNATYTFSKLLPYKDATYNGTWLCGHMQGHGELRWPDGRRYEGDFKLNVQNGNGVYNVETDGKHAVYDGQWRHGKLNGLGTIRYANGDVYEGHFKDDLRHGHGVFKHGHFVMSSAIMYVGQWVCDKKQGYGVMDEIEKGEKYMGIWHDDVPHGRGMLVTLDGMYFEGNFVKGKMNGIGLMYDDNSWYEGEVGPEGTLNGKGILTLPSGDKIEGIFNGSWNNSIKINGVYVKAAQKKTCADVCPSIYGTLCVPASEKWCEIFQHCYELLGIEEKFQKKKTQKAWEAVAVVITNCKKQMETTKSRLYEDFSTLERIPLLDEGESLRSMDCDKYHEIRCYLQKAFEAPFHPLGKLMDSLVDVYRTTYVGIGAHTRLLFHAVEEVHSFVRRINDIIRILFPQLPAYGEEVVLDPNDTDDDLSKEVATADGLLLPILLPKIYPPLFTLYALHNEKDDDIYWETLLKWNKQPDFALMAFLAVDEKFWFTNEAAEQQQEWRANMSTIRESHYVGAIDALQQLSTTFSPLEKLKIVQKVFEAINDEVQHVVASDYVWTMDDLFPVFQYVVVRARIRHLGSEVHMIDDLMEKRLKNGELGIMFTMLRACYFQVKNEQRLAI